MKSPGEISSAQQRYANAISWNYALLSLRWAGSTRIEGGGNSQIESIA